MPVAGGEGGLAGSRRRLSGAPVAGGKGGPVGTHHQLSGLLLMPAG